MTRRQPWDDGIGTGGKTMDAQHRKQVNLVNAVEELVRAGQEAEAVAGPLDELASFTRFHFTAEEGLMDRHAYPHAGEHGAEHARLAAEVSAIREQVARQDTGAALGLIDRLHHWLTGHIQDMDQGFALWCARRSIEPE